MEEKKLVKEDGTPLVGQAVIDNRPNEEQIKVKEEAQEEEKFFPMSHFIKECDLDGCYILQKGRLVVRCAFLTNEASTLLGWTYLDVDLIERMIKRSRKAIKVNMKYAQKIKMRRIK